MHRSGTSMLAGTLEEAGVYLGKVSRKNTHNLKGNLENKRIMSLHNNLLEENGGSWDAPPSIVLWSRKHKKLRKAIIREYREQPIWGLKDPRTLFTVDGWAEAIPDLSFVGIFRHPLLVAGSLRLRNGFSMEKGLGLWFQYNQKLLHYHEILKFPIVSFDDEGLQLLSKIRKICLSLGLNNADRNGTFFEAGLRHSTIDEDYALPEKVLGMYEDLQNNAV
jgi:hypothetical protein